MKKFFLTIGAMAMLALSALTSQAATTTVTVAWDQNKELDIAGYNVFLKSGTNVIKRTVPANQLQQSFTNLVINQSYEFYASAYNTAGIESDYSAILAHTPTPPVLISPTIHYSKFSRDPSKLNGQWSVELRWLAITNAQSYVILTERLGPGEPIGFVKTNLVNDTSYTYTLGLGEYRVWLQSSNEFGFSPRDTSVSSPAVPKAPTNLRLIAQ